MTTEQAKRDWAQDLTEAQIRTIRGLGYIDAIKQVREWTSCDLLAAKLTVDRHQRNQPPTLIAPTVHPGGTPRDELVAQISTALNALDLAIDAIRAACPNHRNYIPQGDGAFQAAQRQYLARLNQVRQARPELKQIMDAILDQRDCAMTEATQPYIIGRKRADEWAEGCDSGAAMWLERHPGAIAFGVDAGAIRVAFVDIYTAGEWLKGVLP